MEQRKRYMLFGFDYHYPQGGEADVIGSFDTMDQAAKVAKEERSDNHEVLDLDTGEWFEL